MADSRRALKKCAVKIGDDELCFDILEYAENPQSVLFEKIVGTVLMKIQDLQSQLCEFYLEAVEEFDDKEAAATVVALVKDINAIPINKATFVHGSGGRDF